MDKLIRWHSFKDMAAKDPETWGDLNEQFHWDENEVAAAAKAQEEFEQRANGARCLEHLIHHVANQVYVFPDESESFDHEDARLLAKLTFVTQLDVTRIAEERELLFDDKSAALIATLPRLRKLSLRYTSLTDEGIGHLATLTTLESLSIFQPESSFLGTHFAKFKALKRLEINCSSIDMKKVADLQKALPECVIEIERRYKVTPVDENEPVEAAQDRLQQAIERSVEDKEK